MPANSHIGPCPPKATSAHARQQPIGAEPSLHACPQIFWEYHQSMMWEGLTPVERTRRRKRLRGLIENMVAADMHAVHVNHSHTTEKLHGFTRKLLMVFMENCDAGMRLNTDK